MKGCNKCPAFAKCTVSYRGSACDALRASYGVDSDPEIITNADKIRAMTDGKLAKCLALTIAYCTSVLCDDKYVLSDEYVCKITDILLRMLQSPAKSEVE